MNYKVFIYIYIKMSSKFLVDKILDAIENGVTIQQLREDYTKYIVSGKEKKIVINSGGEGLKVSRIILEEMKNRGDQLATTLIEADNFYVINSDGFLSSKHKDEYYYANRDKQWTYLEKPCEDKGRGRYRSFDYDRENQILIDILEEGKIKNIGGWNLEVVRVPVEDWTYEVTNANDHWGSEEIFYNM
jgi:hypothetical protein